MSRFLIDAAFIAGRIHNTFFGAPLITAAGKDYTFTFGCVRDILRLRRDLGIKAGVIVIGKETYSVSNSDSVLSLIVVLKELKIPYIHDPMNLGMHTIGRMHVGFTHIVTADKRFLQFCSDDLIVILPREAKQNEWDWLSSDAVKTTVGIAPQDVPTYLALTDPSSSAALTGKQAIRLVELYGNIDSIYANLKQVVSVPIRKKLAESESCIRQRYDEIRCKRADSPMRKSV